MSTKPSFVGFDGNQYDTAAGQIINTLRTANAKNGQVIDGFVKATRTTRSTDLHRRTEKTRTLTRTGLKKPAKYVGNHLQKLAPSNSIEREARAKQIQKHGRVSRFGGAARSAFSAAQTAPKSISGEIISRGRRVSSSTKAAPAPVPSMITSVSHQKLERMLDEALVRADAHKAAMQYWAARHFWRRRWLSGPRRWVVLLVFVSALAATLFVAWQKIPQLSLKAAGLRAHISVTTPTYEPVGYSVAGPAKTVSGAVSLSYQSGAGGNYTISQSESNMTSTMVAHNVVPQGATVQTSQVDGNTVYIYGSENDAAWVNNGVLYTIKDNASLNSDEVLNIVKGINP